MASQKISTTLCFTNKIIVAEFVNDLLLYLGTFYVLTMTIRPVGLGAYCVHSVIDTSLASTETLASLKQLLNTYSLKQNYMSQRESE